MLKDAEPLSTKSTGSRTQSVSELEKQLRRNERKFEQLQARREKDLERLKAVTLARDLLESRIAVLLEDLSEEKDKVQSREKHLAAIEQRSGSGRFARNAPLEDDEPTGGKPTGTSPREKLVDALWFRRTVRLANIAYKERRLVDAQVLFDSALTLRDKPSLWTELGHVLREQELFDGAQAAYERALAKEPKNVENMFLAGYCAEMSDRKIEAAKHYDLAVTTDPTIVERYDHLRDFNARLFS